MCEFKSAGAVSYMSKALSCVPRLSKQQGVFRCPPSPRVKNSKVLEASCVKLSLREQSHTCLMPCVKDLISPQGSQCSKTLGSEGCVDRCVHRSHS